MQWRRSFPFRIAPRRTGNSAAKPRRNRQQPSKLIDKKGFFTMNWTGSNIGQWRAP